MRIQKVSQAWYGMIMSGGLVLLLAILMLCPIVPDGASAVEGEESTPVAQADNVSEPSISMALSSRAELDVTPTASGTFQASTARLQVAVTVPENYEDTGYTVSGYKIYMNAANGNTLKGSNGNNSTIEPVSANTTKANFPNNKWGYNLSSSGTAITNSTIFQPVPTTSAIIEDTDKLANTYDLTFATKVNINIPSDQYNNSVLVSVVAGPEKITGLMLIDNMQDMTSQICLESKEGATKQLTDTRDGQKYWVAKMKDGNCWMTQNLALDITTEGLSASDTDITRDWTATQSADPSVTTVYKPIDTSTVVTDFKSSSTAIDSWNLSGLGKNQWMLGTPLKTTKCDDTTDISTCTKVGFVKIDGSWSPTFEAKEGIFNAPDTDYTREATYITLDYEKKEYDPHYLTGNYYTWNTATAGTGGTIKSRDAVGSICPKGWQLPSAGDTASSPSIVRKTYAGLLKKYGVASALQTPANQVASIGGSYNVAESPLYFIRAGYINYNGAMNVAYNGMIGTSRAESTTGSTYHAGLGPVATSVSSLGSRSWGINVRCVAH